MGEYALKEIKKSKDIETSLSLDLKDKNKELGNKEKKIDSLNSQLQLLQSQQEDNSAIEEKDSEILNLKSIIDKICKECEMWSKKANEEANTSRGLEEELN